MGGAFSSNVATAIENVANTIQTQSQNTQSQYNTCLTTIDINHCIIEGNLDIESMCTVIATSEQINNQMVNSNLKSFIAQSLLQQAQSLVGAAGIGVADANNTATAMINSINTIITTASNVSVQNASALTSIKCNYSRINGNVTFGIANSTNFLSQQMIKQQAINSIVSNVTQSLSQTASATVQGLTGLIIAIAILLFAIGYVLFRPVGMVLSNKFIMVTLITLIILGIIVALFLFQLPPFFNPPTVCTENPTTVGACNGQDSCINPTKQQIAITGPPLRYAYDIIGNGDITLAEDPANFKAGLLQMVIAQFGGWTSQSYAAMNSYFGDPISSATQGQAPPNPLLQVGQAPNYVYNTNAAAWSAMNPALARFLLCKALSIDTSVFVLSTELCYANGQIVNPTGPESALCYQFIPSGPKPTTKDLSLAIVTGGTLTGMYGICNDPTYRLQTFMKKGGFLIPLIFFILTIFFLLFFNRAPSTSAPTSSAATTTPSPSPSSSPSATAFTSTSTR